jgi:Asp-tRNA(Asn)/Glu-tRNA(Gln) amidotransferase B subunit
MGTELDTAGRLLLKGASINHLSKDGNNALMALLNVIDKEDTHWTKKRLNYQTSIKRILEVIQFLIDA